MSGLVTRDYVNQRGEVFVKLSRSKLMDLLNIGGSQKAAQVMKELVDYKLILDKKVGLSKCNEIYLYALADEVSGPNVASKVIPYSKCSSTKKPPSRVTFQKPAGGADDSDHLVTDMDEVQYLLANKIHIDDLSLQYDPKLVDEIGLSIRDMFLSASTAIGKEHKPRLIMQHFIRQLSIHHIEHVIHQYIEATARVEIMNPKKYLQTMIYNSLFETNTKVFSDIRYQFGYY